VYNVVLQQAGLASEAYTLVVFKTRRTIRPRGFVSVTTQVLSSKGGWSQRSKSGELLWSEWDNHTYMTVEEHKPQIEERLNKIEKLAKAGIVL
jgi:hypothetical protein